MSAKNHTPEDNVSSGAGGGVLLMLTAAAALGIANSPAAESYFGALHAHIGPLSVQHWINDALMAVFFLLVGLEIKREMIEGHLNNWPARLLPGVAALGGMLVPALIYITLTPPDLHRGWAIPAATDIAFALGVLALLGSRVPVSLKIFLTALAILDDLGAILIIAFFYSDGLSFAALAAAAAIVAVLFALNRKGVTSLVPYLALGVPLWALMFDSGIHATIAGVLLALTIPTRALVPLEHALSKPVAFFILPVFAFANAGVSLQNAPALTDALPLAIACALALGKLLGVFAATALAVKFTKARLPEKASWLQMCGLALLCGIGFTMSLFITPLAFDAAALQDQAKIGIFLGSFVAGLAGFILLRFAR